MSQRVRAFSSWVCGWLSCPASRGGWQGWQRLCRAFNILVKACSVPIARDTRNGRRDELDEAHLCLPQEEQEEFMCGVFQQCVCQSGSSEEMKSQAVQRDWPSMWKQCEVSCSAVCCQQSPWLAWLPLLPPWHPSSGGISLCGHPGGLHCAVLLHWGRAWLSLEYKMSRCWKGRGMYSQAFRLGICHVSGFSLEAP